MSGLVLGAVADGMLTYMDEQRLRDRQDAQDARAQALHDMKVDEFDYNKGRRGLLADRETQLFEKEMEARNQQLKANILAFNQTANAEASKQLYNSLKGANAIAPDGSVDSAKAVTLMNSFLKSNPELGRHMLGITGREGLSDIRFEQGGNGIYASMLNEKGERVPATKDKVPVAQGGQALITTPEELVNNMMGYLNASDQYRTDVDQYKQGQSFRKLADVFNNPSPTTTSSVTTTTTGGAGLGGTPAPAPVAPAPVAPTAEQPVTETPMISEEGEAKANELEALYKEWQENEQSQHTGAYGEYLRKRDSLLKQFETHGINEQFLSGMKVADTIGGLGENVSDSVGRGLNRAGRAVVDRVAPMIEGGASIIDGVTDAVSGLYHGFTGTLPEPKSEAEAQSQQAIQETLQESQQSPAPTGLGQSKPKTTPPKAATSADISMVNRVVQSSSPSRVDLKKATNVLAGMVSTGQITSKDALTMLKDMSKPPKAKDNFELKIEDGVVVVMDKRTGAFSTTGLNSGRPRGLNDDNLKMMKNWQAISKNIVETANLSDADKAEIHRLLSSTTNINYDDPNIDGLLRHAINMHQAEKNYYGDKWFKDAPKRVSLEPYIRMARFGVANGQAMATFEQVERDLLNHGISMNRLPKELLVNSIQLMNSGEDSAEISNDIIRIVSGK